MPIKMMWTRGVRKKIFPCYRIVFLFVTGTPMVLGSRKRSSTTAPGSLPAAASRETIAAATDGSSSRADPSKDTSKAKEIQAQGVLKPKMSVSNSMCNIKVSSRILREENVHRQTQLLKSKVQILLWLSGIWFQ